MTSNSGQQPALKLKYPNSAKSTQEKSALEIRCSGLTAVKIRKGLTNPASPMRNARMTNVKSNVAQTQAENVTATKYTGWTAAAKKASFIIIAATILSERAAGMKNAALEIYFAKSQKNDNV